MLPRYEIFVLTKGLLLWVNKCKKNNSHNFAGSHFRKIPIRFNINFLLLHRNINNITIWIANLTAQNKNWSLYFFLIGFINSKNNDINCIKVKYLETGQTFISAD